MTVRCSKHPMMWEPCSVCAEIGKLEEQVEDRNAKTIELEAVINDVRRVMYHAEESAKKYAEQTCELQAKLDKQNKELETVFEGSCELEKELNEALDSVEKLSNLAYKSYNPEAKLKLSVNDLLVVRGIFVANSFLFNSLHNIDQCIMQKKDKTTQEQLILIKKDLEKEWQRVVDLLKVFAKEFSDSNWKRMIRETQKIVEVTVDTMNRRDLGHFTVGKNDELDIDYKIRPLVEKAVNTCINSAGTNNLTAYSKELLVKELVRICEEK